MTQHRKHRGYASQRIVAEYLAANGWPYAESTGAGRSGTDVTGCVGIDWEVKARRGLNISALMAQLGERSSEGLLGIGVIRPDGFGGWAAPQVGCVAASPRADRQSVTFPTTFS